MFEAYKMIGWWTSAMSIKKDHIHIIVQIPPNVSVA